MLEPLVPRHAPSLFGPLRDPSLYTYLDMRPPDSVDMLEIQYRAWSARRSPDGSQAWLNWVGRLKESGDYIGWFQSTVYGAERADIAYLVFTAHQRRGYAFEACAAIIEHLRSRYGVVRVGATADARNAASIALARRLGFVLVPSLGSVDDVRYESPSSPPRA